MKLFALFLFLGISQVNSFAAQKMPVDLELSLLSASELSNLTTEALAELDPGQPNPELRRWVVSRKMEITGWKSRKISGGFLGVQGGVMRAAEVTSVRPQGLWYNTIAQFPCEAKEVDPAFETEEGARNQAKEATELWDETLSQGKIGLSVLLSKVAAASEQSALTKADHLFQEWLNRLDREWREKVAREITARQWKLYRSQAVEAGICDAHGHATLKAQRQTLPEEWMVQERSQAASRLLIHVPARRWHGFFAVRSDFGAGPVDVLLQMLIDPATPRSVISPEAIAAQGPSPELFELAEAAPMSVKIKAGNGQNGLGKVAAFGYAKLSGFPLFLQRYLYSPTALFDEPDYFAPCCSGVFGMDLLRRYAVQFEGGKASAIQLWRAEGFQAPRGYQWAEIRETQQGELKAICSERLKKISGAHKLCSDPRVALENLSANLVLDLPHARIWYSPEELAAPQFMNQTGIKLQYGYQSAQRVLEVADLAPINATAQLRGAGFRKGVIVTDVDGLPASEMDLWEVNRHLSGAYGRTVRLKWKTSLGVKTFREDSFQTPDAVRLTGNGN